MKRLFNFDYNAVPMVHPNYRVEYSKKNGCSVSCPAIFESDEQGVREAIKEFPEWEEIGMTKISVLKYTESGITEVWNNE